MASGGCDDGGNGFGERSRMRTVKEVKGGGGLGFGGKRVEEREDSVVEKRWVSCSKTAIWWIRRRRLGTSPASPSRMRAWTLVEAG